MIYGEFEDINILVKLYWDEAIQSQRLFQLYQRFLIIFQTPKKSKFYIR